MTNEKKTKKIFIYANGINKQIAIARDFDWKSGWRIPIYCKEYDSFEEIEEQFDEKNDNEIDISLSYGGWLNDNSYQPDALELYGLASFESKVEDKEDDGEWEIDEVRDYIFESIENYFYENIKNVEIEFEGDF